MSLSVAEVQRLDEAIAASGGARAVVERGRRAGLAALSAVAEPPSSQQSEASGDLSPIKGGGILDVDSLFAGCQITKEFVKDIEDAHFQWKHIVAAAHLCVWAAPGGNGKSTIARKAAADMSRDGLKVLYFMEDAGATDFKYLQRHASENTYTLLNSTAGHKSPEDIFKMIRQLSTSSTRMEGYVLVLDTMKKFLDVMGKAGAREFFKVLRAITTLGGTVLLLGHTNKHKDIEGKLVFEGVGDIRNDIDELFYIEAVDDAQTGDRLATIVPDKVRCAAEACTFRLRKLTLDAVDERLTDVSALAAAALREKQDGHAIAAIESILKARGGESKEKLVAEVAISVALGQHKVRDILRNYSDGEMGNGARWNITRGGLNNSIRVSWPVGRPK